MPFISPYPSPIAKAIGSAVTATVTVSVELAVVVIPEPAAIVSVLPFVIVCGEPDVPATLKLVISPSAPSAPLAPSAPAAPVAPVAPVGMPKAKVAVLPDCDTETVALEPALNVETVTAAVVID